MKVYIEKIDVWKNVKVDNVKELLEILKINPTTVIVSVNDELVSERKLKDKDIVKIHSVISGG